MSWSAGGFSKASDATSACSHRRLLEERTQYTSLLDVLMPEPPVPVEALILLVEVLQWMAFPFVAAIPWTSPLQCIFFVTHVPIWDRTGTCIPHNDTVLMIVQFSAVALVCHSFGGRWTRRTRGAPIRAIRGRRTGAPHRSFPPLCVFVGGRGSSGCWRDNHFRRSAPAQGLPRIWIAAVQAQMEPRNAASVDIPGPEQHHLTLRGRTVRCARAVRKAGCFPPPVATGPRALNSVPQALWNSSFMLL